MAEEFMRAVDIRGGKGPASALFINDKTPKPKPGPGQALVRVKAFGINRMDLNQREGTYPVPPQAPKTLGVEFSGTVAELGPRAADDGNHGLSVGDAVFGLVYGGAYAEYVVASVGMLLRKPDHLSFEEAAGVPETWITATQALHFVGRFNGGESVLWHAGASGVSIAGIQLSRRAGASAVYATAGSAEKCAFVVDKLGATAAVNYHDNGGDWSAEILRRTDSRGVDVVVDYIGADYLQRNLDVAARDGRIVCLGLLSGGKVRNLDMRPLLMKRLRVEGSTLRSRDEAYQRRLRDKLEEYLPHFESGELKIFVDKVFPWEEVQKAHELMEKSSTMGKIICTID
ncbi:hypothetical protein VTK73DRAFT_7301 [Phialemonium thermophilum]|uniref:Enoyl reductase (ER) domain-containing protein n=1 Tax=Phialemonium thermophilum TaxID=223376 RepID=A0ABR3WF80_9PEZI